MSSNPYPPAVNVTPPPQDPKATRQMFRELHNREQWLLYGKNETRKPIMPPPPDPGPEVEEEPDDDEVNPLPVPEISAEFHDALKKDGHTMACWRCGTTDGVRELLGNGAILCPSCIEVLKP